MNGDTFGFTILPDQMQVANPVLILLFIPLFDYVIYPTLCKYWSNNIRGIGNKMINSKYINVIKCICKYMINSILAKFNLFKTPLQRIIAGGVLAGVSFIVSGCLELEFQVCNFVLIRIQNKHYYITGSVILY